MYYKPNFCAECGTRVERAGQRLWSSGRFCPACARRFGAKWVVMMLLFCSGLIALGFALGRTGRMPKPPLVIERGATTTATPLRADAVAETKGGNARVAQTYGLDGTTAERPTDPLEVVSICGARTKKGTPCSRRVRGTGRCWQHRGKAAMLPPEKLVVPN